MQIFLKTLLKVRPSNRRTEKPKVKHCKTFLKCIHEGDIKINTLNAILIMNKMKMALKVFIIFYTLRKF